MSKKYMVNQGCMSLSTYFLEYGRHVARLRRRRAYAPTSNTASHDNHEKILHGFPFLSHDNYGAPLRGPSGRRNSANINRCASPFCEYDLDSESVKQFFLFCPRYAAQRNVLFTSTATILGETWSSSSDARKINFLLYGVKSVNNIHEKITRF